MEDINRKLRGLAEKHGFARIWFISADLLPDEERAEAGGRCILLLAYSYNPFDGNEHIPAYYLASNRAYHAFNDFMRDAEDEGISAARPFIRIKPLCEAASVGTVCRNGLVDIDGLGTRVVFMVAAADGCEPERYSCKKNACGGCSECTRACPMVAISSKGVDYSRCIRAYMNDADHPDFVKEHLTKYLGCEVCQDVCPRNGALNVETPSEAARDAFDIQKLLAGDTKAARELVGRNKSGNGKLTAEAVVFASRRDDFRALAKAAEQSPFEAVKNALLWANRQRGDK